MEICIVSGARPNFIKEAPLIRQINNLRRKGSPIGYSLVYTGRADDPTLEGTLFDDLSIHRPDECLGVGCENLNELTGQVMSRFETYLQRHPADAVVVVDDLASTMAAAIVTKKQGILLAHIAAGTRSFDINMPKEINRLVIDGLSDLLFTAGISNNSIANREGAELSKVYMVGNILVDNLRFCHQRIEEVGNDPAAHPALAPFLGVPYLVLTLNRKSLIANMKRLEAMLRVIDAEATRAELPVVAPLRGTARHTVEAIVRRLGLKSLQFADPLDYLEFGFLTAHALGIITDSGNVAEEATFNGVPCITLNSYTEHIETVKVGTNVLVGENPDLLRTTLADMTQGRWKKAAIPDRWDGRSAERAVATIEEQLKGK